MLYSGLLLATGFSSGLSSAFAADPTGDWRVADGVANIRVAQCNGDIWGVVAWEKQPGGRDSNNPDAAKKTRPTLGMPILLDMKKKPGTDSWEGQVYNAKDGQTYSSTITPSGPDQLEIQGCVLGFLCGGETWTRVGPPIPSSPSNSMAKDSTKSPAAKSAVATSPAAKTVGAAPKSAAPAPKMAAPLNPATRPSGQKTAAQPAADTVGDICLLPDIAGFAH
jgi:uncharacterized protein (DUF2147 family)